MHTRSTAIERAGKANITVGDLVEALGKTRQANGFSELLSLLANFPDLMELLHTAKDITLFAPTNLAIKNRADSIASETLHDLLAYHIVLGDVGTYATAPLVNIMNTHLTAGRSDRVGLPQGESQKLVVVNNEQKNFALLYGNTVPAATLQDAFECTNGKVFPISTLLLPPVNLMSVGALFGLNTFIESLAKVALASEYLAVNGMTLFVPKSDVLQDYLFRHPKIRLEQLAFLLMHHAVRRPLYTSMFKADMVLQSDAEMDLVIETKDGINFTVNRIPIVTPNIITANGVIHVIDGLLNPYKQRVSSQQTIQQQTPSNPSAELKNGDGQGNLVDDGEITNARFVPEDDNVPNFPDVGSIKKDLVEDLADDDASRDGNKRIVADARSGSDRFNESPCSTYALFSIIIASILGLYI